MHARTNTRVPIQLSSTPSATATTRPQQSVPWMNGNITWCGKEYAIAPFFSLNSETEGILLETPIPSKGQSCLSPSQSIRITILSFLEELEKVGVVDLEGWNNAQK